MLATTIPVNEGGKVLSRAKINIIIEISLKSLNAIWSATTDRLIESILKANDKGQIKNQENCDTCQRCQYCY